MMPENVVKVPRSASPAARAGAGDISERELSRERHNLQTTPPARLQPTHRKKQLFLTPINKFTTNSGTPSPNLARIRSCLDEFKGRGIPRPVKITPKALSMEDLTPTKRCRQNKNVKVYSAVKAPTVYGIAEEQAAARIGRFMLVSTWRRRREDIRCLRKTLETQVSCSERLRIQVCALKSLLDSDNAKVRMAMKELERLKQLLRDKDLEKAVLEREKRALEDDVCAAEDRASEMSIGWRNARNELDTARTACASRDLALTHERAAAVEARNHRDRALAHLTQVEEELAEHEELLANAEAEVEALRREVKEQQKSLAEKNELLRIERENRERCSRECSELKVQVSVAAAETVMLKSLVEELRVELVKLDKQLRVTREQLEWWPKPLTRLLGLARSWFRSPMSMPEAILWNLVPVRHGC